MKTIIKFILAVGLVGVVVLLWVWRPIAPYGQDLGRRTNDVSRTTQPFAERRVKQPQQAQEGVIAGQELLQLDLPLDTEQQRQDFYDQLLKCPPLKLYQAWKASLSSDKERHKGLLEVALADLLKLSLDQPEAKELYSEAMKFLNDSSESDSSKIRMIKWLGQSGTPGALALLLDKLSTATGELRFELLRQLASVGNNPGRRIDSERLSALLEANWQQAAAAERPDARLVGPLAQALAKVGDPKGVQMLLDEVARSGDSQDARVLAAFTSFTDIRNDASVSVLAKALSNQGADSSVLIAAGEGLAAIGNENSTLPLIAWAQAAGDEYASVAEYLFSKLKHPVAIKKARYAFIENYPFKSEKVRAAVQGALARTQ